MIFDWDDFGANHIISGMCQSHDCRDVLEKLHEFNPNFKCTLFAIPGEMTQELLDWSKENNSWVQLALHGFYHSSNYECEKMSYEQMDEYVEFFYDMIEDYFVKGFRAPGWQISDDVLRWLSDNGWWLADQGYNDERRPKWLKAYVNYNGSFQVKGEPVEAYHGHVWDVGEKGNEPNGIYEDIEKVEQLVATHHDYKFISELF